MRWAVLFCLVHFPTLAQAGPPILLDKNTIEVTTSFRGTDIGVTSYLANEGVETKLVIIGPPATLTFRQKARRAGLWVNAKKQVLKDVASYVALIGYTEAELRAACDANTIKDLAYEAAPPFAWICNDLHRDLMADKGLFVLSETDGLNNMGQGFVRGNAFLPPTAKPGRYGLRFWANGESAQAQLNVRRAGLERWVLKTAEEHRILYGILCLMIAGLAGYLTNLIFSRRA